MIGCLILVCVQVEEEELVEGSRMSDADLDVALACGLREDEARLLYDLYVQMHVVRQHQVDIDEVRPIYLY